MNRSFPGKERSNTTERMANRIYRRFVAQCDLGLDFHTSTQNRTTIYHARPTSTTPKSGDSRGRTRRTWCCTDPATRVAPVDGDRGRDPDRHGRDGARTPVPAGAHREGVGGSSVLAEYELTPGEAVHWPGWFQSTAADSTKRWLRADTGGLVEMEWGPYPLVYEGETICTITNHFKTEEHAIEGPFDGLIVGSLENPVAAAPGTRSVTWSNSTRDAPGRSNADR